MAGGGAEAVALLALAAALAFAMLTPRGLPEATVAVPAALALMVIGVVSWSQAWGQIRSLGPTVGFLAAVLVLAHLVQVEGVFDWLGGWLARRATSRPRRLLLLVFGAASVVTAVLSLDATVVLLTPVVALAADHVGARPRPHLYACAHLANSASQLMPVSNLTNLLAFAACGLSFGGFTALMALPWIVAIAVEYVVLRTFFRRDLRRPRQAPQARPVDVDASGDGPAGPTTPVFALVVLAATLAGFAVSGLVDLEPVWVATAGAAVLAVRGLARRTVRPPALLAAASPLFCVFVLALGVIVEGTSTHGLRSLLVGVLPATSTLPALLLTAATAALLANIVNNIPATLLLLGALAAVDPIGSAAHVGLVLAVLIGVNIGPNLTYIGSLATLLWRRVLTERGAAPDLATFSLLGALSVPLGLAATVVVLWAELRIGS